MKNTTYINNKFINHNKAKISVDDRGFLFADSVYELICVLNKKIIDLDQHLNRLKISLKKVKIKYKLNKKKFEKIINKLVKLNKIFNGYVYIQITRGVAERKHEFPDKYHPSTIIFTKHLKINKEIYEKGVKIITIPDIRWLRRDIKTTSLLPNVLSKQLAVEKNAFESWLIDNGNITEGSSSNAWIIKNSNTIVTHPANNKILRGITRDTIIKILKKNGFNIKEKPFNLIEAKNAKEAFLTSSTLSVLPVVKIDNYNIANGKPGDITKKIINLYNNYISKNKTTLYKELKIA
jgi:D-alanine transaminase